MKEIRLIIDDDTDDLDTNELAEFLYLFQGASVALSRVVDESEELMPAQLVYYNPEEEMQRIASFTPSQIDSIFDAEAEDGKVKIGQISRHSPLEMVLYGSTTLLVLAAIFAGGKIKLLSGLLIEAELRSLGEGIEALRKALGLDKQIDVGFGVREVTIKLNMAEYRELMKQIQGQGGFQNFFRGLQSRINKSTKELTLSSDDLERIYKHKSKPQAGGYQARLRKIFERHFPNISGSRNTTSLGEADEMRTDVKRGRTAEM